MKWAVWFLCAFWAASLPAAPVAVLLSGDSGPYKEALDGLKAVVGQDLSVATLPAMPDLGGAKVVVTFGGEAALKKFPAGLAQVAALLPDPNLKLKHGGSVTRIGLTAAPGLLLGRVKGLLPGASAMAVLDNGNYSAYIAGLKDAGPGAGLGIQSKQVADMGALAGVLPGLKDSVKALWVPPDPLFMNPKTFGLLSQFCRSAGIGMVAPIAGLARAGALAGIAPSFRQQGQAAGSAALAYLGGGSLGTWVYADKTEFIVNKTVAKELGVSAGAVAKADSTVE